jgi:hypothetical protein
VVFLDLLNGQVLASYSTRPLMYSDRSVSQRLAGFCHGLYFTVQKRSTVPIGRPAIALLSIHLIVIAFSSSPWAYWLKCWRVRTESKIVRYTSSGEIMVGDRLYDASELARVMCARLPGLFSPKAGQRFRLRRYRRKQDRHAQRRYGSI